MKAQDRYEGPDRLVALHEMKGYRISKGESDIRGWDVVAADQRRVGKVHELIVDSENMKVRYLDIDIDPKILGTKKSSHVLVPIAGARLDDEDNRVYINRFSSNDVSTIPPYDHRPLKRDYEANLLGMFGGEHALREGARSAAEPVRTADRGETVRAVEDRRAAEPRLREGEPLVDDSDFYEDERFSDRDFWGSRRHGREGEDYVTRSEE